MERSLVTLGGGQLSLVMEGAPNDARREGRADCHNPAGAGGAKKFVGLQGGEGNMNMAAAF